MAVDERAEPAQFKLYRRNRDKLVQIARHLSSERGQPVSRSEALRHLITSFSLPDRSESRTAIIEPNIDDTK